MKPVEFINLYGRYLTDIQKEELQAFPHELILEMHNKIQESNIPDNRMKNLLTAMFEHVEGRLYDTDKDVSESKSPSRSSSLLMQVPSVPVSTIPPSPDKQLPVSGPQNTKEEEKPAKDLSSAQAIPIASTPVTPKISKQTSVSNSTPPTRRPKMKTPPNQQTSRHGRRPSFGGGIPKPPKKKPIHQRIMAQLDTPLKKVLAGVALTALIAALVFVIFGGFRLFGGNDNAAEFQPAPTQEVTSADQQPASEQPNIDADQPSTDTKPEVFTEEGLERSTVQELPANTNCIDPGCAPWKGPVQYLVIVMLWIILPLMVIWQVVQWFNQGEFLKGLGFLFFFPAFLVILFSSDSGALNDYLVTTFSVTGWHLVAGMICLFSLVVLLIIDPGMSGISMMFAAMILLNAKDKTISILDEIFKFTGEAGLFNGKDLFLLNTLNSDLGKFSFVMYIIIFSAFLAISLDILIRTGVDLVARFSNKNQSNRNIKIEGSVVIGFATMLLSGSLSFVFFKFIRIAERPAGTLLLDLALSLLVLVGAVAATIGLGERDKVDEVVLGSMTLFLFLVLLFANPLLPLGL